MAGPRLPCTRGDSPYPLKWPKTTQGSALHTRGFTHVKKVLEETVTVCPAHAGIHPRSDAGICGPIRLPCTRGDSPPSAHMPSALGESALHTRGFTAGIALQGQCPRVCPAHAGIHRTFPMLIIRVLGMPRTRGDSPEAQAMQPGILAYAPHTRGLIPGIRSAPRTAEVCPAHAGSHPPQHIPVYGPMSQGRICGCDCSSSAGFSKSDALRS